MQALREIKIPARFSEESPMSTMMNRLVPLGAIVGAVCMTVAAGTPPRAQHLEPGKSTHSALVTACRAPDGFANNFRAYAGRVVSGSSTSSVSLRQAWNIPAAADSEVVFVSDSTLCAE